jgi:rare lipoprotein A
MPDRVLSSCASGQNSPWILLLAGALSVTTGGALVTVFTVTVQADAPLPRPASTLPPTPRWAGVDPDSLAPTLPEKKPHLLRGIASWYGSDFDGRQTASGEFFDMNALTACHPTLPFGTLVRVVNLRNKRSVVVRINDRGPLTKRRVIDLSYAAARELMITERGLAPVVLEVVSLGTSRRGNH